MGVCASHSKKYLTFLMDVALYLLSPYYALEHLRHHSLAHLSTFRAKFYVKKVVEEIEPMTSGSLVDFMLNSYTWINPDPLFCFSLFTCQCRFSKCFFSFLQECGYDLLCPELLLPLRQPGGHHGIGRRVEILLVRLLVSIWGILLLRRLTASFHP